ncbi:MarR family winged helix-turn-helix transcriptional regulator [Paenibacillus sp. NPDC058071]|uniref:MarR family winged helix-turn-helix transcriptional regulator n=1 Tax=Paenibacillus sp. NPDC058071 TaxID=3346326 RepID=UPI0036DE1303
MENNEILHLIRSVEMLTNEAVVKWTKMFDHNIGISPILVLQELKAESPQKQTVLAETLAYTPGAITNISGKLVKLGYAERIYNDEDRRQILLGITEKGLSFLDEVQEKGDQLRMELFRELNDEEIKQYLAINEKLLQALRKTTFTP